VASGEPVHADQIVRHFGCGSNGDVNALRLPGKIDVECAQDDTCVAGIPVLMKAKKVAAIVGAIVGPAESGRRLPRTPELRRPARRNSPFPNPMK
jgi:hypothetical protein